MDHINLFIHVETQTTAGIGNIALYNTGLVLK